MTMTMTVTAELKISKAKSKLIMYHPFFASILCNLPMIEDNSIPTMATNGKLFKFNREFVDGMTPDETEFVLCHEVGHCMFGHMFRRGARNPKRWNMAGDYIINDLLVADNIGTMPQQGLYNPQLVQAGGGCAEGVYTLIPESNDGNNGDTGIDCCEDAPGDAAEQATAEAEMKVSIAQAAQAAKMCGKLSTNLERFVGEALQPRVNWKDAMWRWMTAKAKVDLSYARPKRRWLASEDEPLILPSLTGVRMGEIANGLDMSGSVGEHECRIFSGELQAIKEQIKPSKMHNIYFGSQVCRHDVFEEQDELVFNPCNGGGTAFSPIFKFVDDQGIEPVCAVILTDLCCDDFGPPPPYPVLWVSTMPGTAPWGEVVLMDMRDR